MLSASRDTVAWALILISPALASGLELVEFIPALKILPSDKVKLRASISISPPPAPLTFIWELFKEISARETLPKSKSKFSLKATVPALSTAAKLTLLPKALIVALSKLRLPPNRLMFSPGARFICEPCKVTSAGSLRKLKPTGALMVNIGAVVSLALNSTSSGNRILSAVPP